MKLNRLLSFTIAVVLLCVPLTLCFSQISLVEISLDEAEESIEMASLPYLLYFSADWCPSCKLMETSTFKNRKLNELIRSHMKAFKINVDALTAQKWMQNYTIHSLPTLLLYSKDHKLYKRIERPVKASELISILQATLDNEPSEKVELATSDGLDNEYNSTIIPREFEANQNLNIQFTPSIKDEVVSRYQKILQHLQLKPPIQNGNQYIVEVGNYKNVRVVERLVQTLRNRVSHSVKVLIEDKKSVTQFKVYLGEFISNEEAIQALKKLKRIKHNGVLRKF